MSYRFTRQRVRLAIDVAVKKGAGAIRDAITGQLGKFARNAGVQFEIALTYNGSIIDISNILTAVLEIKANNDPDGTLAMTKTIGVSQMNTALTQNEWDTGEAAKAHFVFTFSSTDAAESVFGSPTPEDEATHWIVLWGYTNDDSVDVDVFGVGQVISFDAGKSGGVVAPPSSQNGITLDQLAAMLEGYVKKIGDPGDTITLVAGVSKLRVKLSATEEGDLGTDTQVST